MRRLIVLLALDTGNTMRVISARKLWRHFNFLGVAWATYKVIKEAWGVFKFSKDVRDEVKKLRRPPSPPSDLTQYWTKELVAAGIAENVASQVAEKFLADVWKMIAKVQVQE